MAEEPKDVEVINLGHVVKAADSIRETNWRCYKRALASEDYESTNNFRTSCMDNLEGLKSLMIAARLHDTQTYTYLTDMWDEVLQWP